MSTTSIGGNTALIIQSLVDMRARFNDLQRQLATGQKSDTYAGLGLNRGVTVSLNAQLSAIGGYNDTIANVMTRVNLMNSSLGRMNDIAAAAKTAMLPGTSPAGVSVNMAQQQGQSSLDELVGLLNSQAGDRYLFSGRATDQPAVETSDHILNGDGTRAGLKQLIAERTQADLGANGLGRLNIAASGTSVSLTEDAVPFGIKLGSVTSTVYGASASGPAGSPASLAVDFAGSTPQDGQAVTLRLTLPDGTSQNLTLTATSNAPPGANQFTIGATAGATATNFQAALATSVGKVAGTSLAAASAVSASNDFFSADANNPPQRVDGPPFDTATGMRAGTAAETVVWYTGEAGSDPARGTATARIDQSLVVGYGARANEAGIRSVIQNVATLAAVAVSPADPNAADLGAALNQRLTVNLSNPAGGQSITDIETQLAGAQIAMTSAQSRNKQTTGTLSEFLQQIQGVSNEEVGAEILSLQTRMQASMQTTAMLFQTSLVNYLK
jgi:flagellar hook-associated protein 3 FlgL